MYWVVKGAAGAALWGSLKHYTRLEKPAWNKDPSLLDPFVSCKENKVL
jgi:hypothetical protein